MFANMRSYILPPILTLGGFWITYVGFNNCRILYHMLKLTYAKPNPKEIEQYWMGLSYNPQNLAPKKIQYILERSRLLNFEKSFQYTNFVKKIRQSVCQNDLRQFVEAIVLEYDVKMESSKRQIKAFLEFKNHSFEQFWMINQEIQINNQELKNANLLHVVNVFLCLKRQHYKLPTIDECLIFLRQAIPLLKESQQDLKQIQRIVEIEGIQIINLLFVFSYWIDLIQLKLQKQFEIYYVTLDYIQINKVPIQIRDEMKLLLNEFFQIVEKQGI